MSAIAVLTHRQQSADRGKTGPFVDTGGVSPLRWSLLAPAVLVSTLVSGCGVQDTTAAPTVNPSRSVSDMSTDVWTFYERAADTDRSNLTDVQRAALAICDLRQEVNAGGFDAYFRYWGGNTAPEALAALPAALGDEWASLLNEAMQVLGPNYPSDPDARAELLDQGDLENRLNDLDTRYYELEESVDADQRLNAFLRTSDQ